MIPLSAALYIALVALVGLERIVELILTRRHIRYLEARGGRVVKNDPYGWMVLLHTAFLIACPLEVVLLERPFLAWIGWPMLGLLAATMMLRYWVIATLGDRWTTRVVVVPGEAPIVRGPYRLLRHPNYVAVVLELIALPLIHGAWWTALAASLLNALVLRARIRVEEDALTAVSNYREALGGKPRFLPDSRT